QADDAWVTMGDLLGDIGAHLELTLIVLAAVRVRAVDHQPLRQSCGGEIPARRVDARSVVVRRLPAAQDDVAVLVAPRLDDRHLPVLVDLEEMMPLAHSAHPLD